MINPKKNIKASIKARLINLSRVRNRPFQELLQYYGMERFLFRLSKSNYKEQFILKGALLFKVWGINYARATADIDMLAQTSNSLDNLMDIIRDICAYDFSPSDGIIFHPDTVTGKIMQTQREYDGIRIQFKGSLDSAKIPMQIDIGFGDVVTPMPQEILYPVLLEHPAPQFRGYPPETVIAEKLQTMLEKGLLNSRIKDYYDVWILSSWFKFDYMILADAISKTFGQRGSQLDLSGLIQILQQYGSSKDRQALWELFRKKNALLDIIPQSLGEICRDIAVFINQTLATQSI